MRRAAAIFIQPGCTYEMRVLGCTRGTFKFNSSGYFNDADQLVHAAIRAEHLTPSGVFITANPVLPALLGRANNRLIEKPPRATSDNEIVERRWLIFDIDPCRPSGICASEEERAAALRFTTDVEAVLSSLGFPVPAVKMSSGNGFYLFYGISLPNDNIAKSLIERIYAVVADKTAESSHLHNSKLDQAVSSAAQLVRLVATWNRKGDSIETRPHRPVEILDATDVPVVLPRDLLEAVAAKANIAAPHAAVNGSNRRRSTSTKKPPNSRLDIPRWLRDRGREFKEKRKDDGLAVYELSQCPFNPSHSEHGVAAFFQNADGRPGFNCHHESCKDFAWNEGSQQVGPPGPEHYATQPPNAAANTGAVQAGTPVDSSLAAAAVDVEAALIAMQLIDTQGENEEGKQLQALLECAVEYGLSDAQVLAVIPLVTSARPLPRQITKAHIAALTRQVEKCVVRGTAATGKKRPKIDAFNHDLSTVTSLVWSALEKSNEPPTIFRYAGIPSRIEIDDNCERIIRPLDFTRMKHHLAREIFFFKVRMDGETPVEEPASPPAEVVHDVLAKPDPPLPILNRLVEVPVFAPDGTLHETPGYLDRSKVFYSPPEGFEMPPVAENPSEDDIAAARELLCVDLLGEFPFVSKSELAHAVALLLLPFARDVIDGPTPLHLVEKPSPGTGATLMTDMLSLPATGRPIAAMTEGRDEDEWRKRITAKLRTSPPFLLIDNLNRRLDSASVSSAITAPAWEDRVLGGSTMVRIPVRCAWIATGNNPSVSTEISRRTVRIRLDARMDRPWLRDGFRHPDLREWAHRHRGQLVWAACTLIRAWLVAGRPAGQQVLGMFEHWARVMGGILDIAGVPGFLSNLEEFYEESDQEGSNWRGFLMGWWEQFGIEERKVVDLHPVAVEACMPLGDGSEQSQKIILGRMLTERRDRAFDMEFDGDPIRVVIQRGKRSQRAYHWQLRLESR